MRSTLAFVVAVTAFASVHARPQTQASSSTVSASYLSSGSSAINLANATTVTDFTVPVPTGPYLTYSSQIILSTSSGTPNYGNATTRASNSTISSSATQTSVLVGTNHPSTLSATATKTSSASTPSNTQKCNGYVEFCNKQYMNVTEVCAHNSAFAVKNNVASNQLYSITAQLNDGVRMIQGETHYYNNSIYSCHTSCDMLNAGLLQSNLQEVAAWVEQNPYDVVTILIVNSDYRNVTDYVAPIQNSGLAPYLYEPSRIPMRRTDWPTYAEMIISQKRVVIFMDYQANQTAVPYVLDEFSQMWETPFSPTDASFPCTQQRPPNLSDEDANNLPYIANHNLNLQISFSSIDILVPAYPNLTTENAVSGFSSAGEMMDNCLNMWTRPPSWLLVDYYNYGEWPGSGRSANNSGSVFEVAARMNNVTYNAACCGPADGNAAASLKSLSRVAMLVGAAVLGVFFVY